jgi:ABC-type uncharacterized transport system auxiliary subunit
MDFAYRWAGKDAIVNEYDAAFAEVLQEIVGEE